MNFYQTIVAVWMLMTALNLKNSKMHNSVAASTKQTGDIFCEFFLSTSVSVPWQVEDTGDVQ
jgi:hypothetical protein